MAKHDNRSNEHRDPETGRFERDRRRDRVVGTVKDRPYATAAALATVAAGAAAFFLAKKADKPLMKWGQPEGDHVKGAGAYKGQGSTTDSSSLETGSTSPSSSAGLGAGTGGTSPSAIQAASLETKGTSGIELGKSGSDTAGNSGSAKSSTGLDETAKGQTKTGSVAYGA